MRSLRFVKTGARPASFSTTTIAESLGRMEEGYRVTLLTAARGDQDGRQQALATMLLLWPMMPTEVRHDVEEFVERSRSLAMLLPKVRSRNSGGRHLGDAMR